MYFDIDHPLVVKTLKNCLFSIGKVVEMQLKQYSSKTALPNTAGNFLQKLETISEILVGVSEILVKYSKCTVALKFE